MTFFFSQRLFDLFGFPRNPLPGRLTDTISPTLSPLFFSQRLFDHFGFARLPDDAPAWAAVLSPEDDRHVAGPSEGDMRKANFTMFKREAMLPETRAVLAKFFAPFNRKVSGGQGRGLSDGRRMA